MELLVSLLGTLNSLSPLAVIALLGLVLLLQARNKAAITEVTNNHLHGLPDMAASLLRIEDLLQDVKDNTVFIKARINGRAH